MGSGIPDLGFNTSQPEFKKSGEGFSKPDFEMEFGISDWRTYEDGIRREWLLTNGIGGYASSTIIGSNARRYHGLLIASLKPPVQRHLILSKIDESITASGVNYDIYSYEAGGSVKKGFYHLHRFTCDPLPTFVYRLGDIQIQKTICMVYGENTTILSYHIKNGSNSLKLRLTPLVNFRNHHQDSRKEHMRFKQAPNADGTCIRPYDLDTEISLYCQEGCYTPFEDCWFENMEYAIERERGLQSVEDHLIPGCFDIFADAWEEKYATLVVTVEKGVKYEDGRILIEKEKQRIKALTDTAGYRGDRFASALAAACDNFIVYRKSTGSKTIIAGYPWFTDWGRDTMISLSGLTLATGRFEDARQILSSFSKYEKDGLLPNVFPDEGKEPAYNSVDAPLWYFEAVNKYLSYSGDLGFVKNELFSTLKRIYSAYSRPIPRLPHDKPCHHEIGSGHSGTEPEADLPMADTYPPDNSLMKRFGIGMDEDFLITAGNEDTQLTWMDARVGGRAVTPRHGKAVEINALWYNASRIMEKLAADLKYEDKLCIGGRSLSYGEIAERTRESFEKSFWNPEQRCLYDVIGGVSSHSLSYGLQNGRMGGYPDSCVRPNQIISASLSHPVITGDMARAVVLKVWRELYAIYGLRTLSENSMGYCGCCIGDQYARDAAYHQGTVWVWPLGHFITAFVRNFGTDGVYGKIISSFFEPFREHLRDACVGNISEIFDGNPPYYPRGCFAQAWSVGEILRAYTEDYLPGIKGLSDTGKMI